MMIVCDSCVGNKTQDSETQRDEREEPVRETIQEKENFLGNGNRSLCV